MKNMRSQFRTPMLAKPLKLVSGVYEDCAAADATHIKLHMPGPLPDRILPVIQKGTRDGTNSWTWNGSCEAPTLKPSILSETHEQRCHTWVNDGSAQFLNDCSHELAGQTVSLLPIDCDNCPYCGGLRSPEDIERGLDICEDCRINIAEIQ